MTTTAANPTVGARSRTVRRAAALLVVSLPLAAISLFPLGRTAGLAPPLASAVAKAQVAALFAGHPFVVTSGRRSAAHQQHLLDVAVARYGSLAEAERWVLTPQRSQHVRGRAVDVRPVAGAGWLEQEGYRWGLCRRYANESWHFELLTTPGRPCPAPQADAADQRGSSRA